MTALAYWHNVLRHRHLAALALFSMFLSLQANHVFGQGHTIGTAPTAVVATAQNSTTKFGVNQVSPQNPLPLAIPSAGSASANFPVKATYVVTANSPVPSNTNLTANVTITASSWTLGSVQWSQDNKTFQNVTTQTTPAFVYDSPQGASTSSTLAQVPIYAVAGPHTTPGYWRVTINLASVSYTLNGGAVTLPVASTPPNPNAVVSSLPVTFVVGAQTPIPGFKVSIQPNSPPVAGLPTNTLTVFQKAGATALITVTSVNHGSGTITVSGASPGFMTYIYSNSNIQDNRGGPTATSSVAVDGSATFTLMLCADMTPLPAPTNPTTLDTLTVTCTSNTAPPASGTVPVQVNSSTSTNGSVTQKASAFPGGLGRRIETPITTRPHFLAIRASVTLPNIVSLVLCGGPSIKGRGDTADVYVGSTNLDFGLTIGHTGKNWVPVINNKQALWVGLSGTLLTNNQLPSDQYAPGTAVNMTLEYPGYPREANNEPRLGPALEDYPAGDTGTSLGTIKAGFVVLNINGTDHILKFPRGSGFFQSKGGYDVKRCNTIAQDVNSKNPDGTYEYPPGDGPGGLFWLTGSAVKGGAWHDVQILLSQDQRWYPMVDQSNPKANQPYFVVKDTSTPGKPYVTSTVITPYSDEEDINMSTQPLQ